MTGVTAYVGLGSNLDNPLDQVNRAVAELEQLPDTRVAGVSPWYRSDPIGPGPQPDYINGVAALVTKLTPHHLLSALQALEDRHQRKRDLTWGPRTLDLDILLYGDTLVSDPDLRIPHPRLGERNFVLLPLADIAPGLILPDGTPLHQLLAKTPVTGIVRLSGGGCSGSAG